MPDLRFAKLPTLLAVSVLILAGCASTTQTASVADDPVQSSFERDRAAILAMAGDFRVTFDFIETVAFGEGYELKEQKESGARESVRVIEDTGTTIRLQHILLIQPPGADAPFALKHWRQDWHYEPAKVLTYLGDNAWVEKDVPEDQRRGAWSQIVYQVDDAPRYGAVGRWDYSLGAPQWTGAPSLRPLPRRDATTRDDYNVIHAVNRHALTPTGWVHEQDNSKLVVGETTEMLVREVAVNTYNRSDEVDGTVAEAYWEKTGAFWQQIAERWESLVAREGGLALTVEGEPEAVYMPILGAANDLAEGTISLETALSDALAVIDAHSVTADAQIAARD